MPTTAEEIMEAILGRLFGGRMELIKAFELIKAIEELEISGR